MSFCDDREGQRALRILQARLIRSPDACSFALTAVSSLLRKYSIDPRRIGRLEVGTESLVDKSKSIKSFVMQLFEESGNFDIEGVDTVNACYGGTNALFNAVNWVESSAWDGRDAIVVASDISLYGKGNARPTGGAGCVAMLVGPDAPIAFEPGRRGSYMAHTYDFYKPDFTTEYPYINGKHSIECYIQAVEACYRAYTKRERRATERLEEERPDHQAGYETPLDRFDYLCFHSPTNKLVSKSYARLLYVDYLENPANPIFAEVPDSIREVEYRASLTDKSIEKTFMGLAQERFARCVQPSTEIPNMCGNMYSASVYGSLCSLLCNVNSETLLGKRITIFSYGSGLASSMFSLKVRGSTKQMAEKLDVHRRLVDRVVVSPEDVRERAYLKKCFKPKGGAGPIPADVYSLAEVDELFRRVYTVKS
uniref:Hydroxymethylglutaryl-CoA synthase-like protein AKT4-1 n=1 Tax=Alternaria alternata TaxID=5599 RepID=AKT41_ALTAL|nr:RecName: Full=Hydroxymethylglutaryl-CoA synthase-like protein AKT4-1; AltName: Full=AK-toxin biosynthesis protein 4-1 [Alternaria alternata]BAO10625.1 hydroxymethylglutaryl-CoA synthase [Alternaria alternata]